MERCVLVASLPTPSPEFDPAIQFTSGSQLDLWILDGTAELLPSISWGLAPRRQQLFTTFAFGLNHTYTSEEFRCPSGSFVTMEFACSDGQKQCQIDFWQHPDIIKSGAFIVDSAEVMYLMRPC
jgi:hypothetical protein